MEFTIRPWRDGDAAVVEKMVRDLFAASMAADCTPEGERRFAMYTAAPSMLERQRHGYFMLTATAPDGSIAGVIEIKACKHISMLFVTQNYQRRGIARQLIARAEILARRIDPSQIGFTLLAARSALPAYEKMGFEATGTAREEGGFHYLPMYREFNAAASRHS